jgi:predicted helicase
MAGDLFGELAPAERPPRAAQVRHASLWGSRENKYHWLQNTEWEQVHWQALAPRAPLLMFVPVNDQGRDLYDRGTKVTEIFPVHTTGIVSARDGLAMDFDAAALTSKIEKFLNPKRSDDEVRLNTFGPSTPGAKYPAGDSRGWKMDRARNELRLVRWQQSISQCLYRVPQSIGQHLREMNRVNTGP